MSKPELVGESGISPKVELERLVTEFEEASEALPPDEHALRQWMLRARDLYMRVDRSYASNRNKLLQKIKAFRTRVWIMRTDRRQYRAKREELGLASHQESMLGQVPTQLAHQKRHKLSQAIGAAWQHVETKLASAQVSSPLAVSAPVQGGSVAADAARSPSEMARAIDKSRPTGALKPAKSRMLRRERLPALPQQSSTIHSTRLDPISAIVGRLARPGSFDEARAITSLWLRKKGFKVPHPLPDNFELEGPVKGHHAMAVGIPGIWAMQAETADTSIEGRRWRVEIVLVDAPPTPAVAVTLTAISAANQSAPAPSVPILVSQLIERIGLLDTEAGEMLSARPVQVDTTEALQRLLRSLQSSRRHRPAIVLSTYLKEGRTASLLDPEMLAKRLRGIAKVYVLSREMAWALTDALSKRFAVAGACARLFRPGFTPDDDSGRHPAWKPDALRAQGLDLAGLSRLFEREAANASLRALEQEDVIQTFDRVREKVLRKQIELARRQVLAASMGDELSEARATALQAALNDETTLREMYEEENEAQRQDLQRLRGQQDTFHAEQEAWRAREYHFQDRIASLQRRLIELGASEAPKFPDNWNELEDWCEEHLKECVSVTPKAIRAARDSLFENVPFCYEVLLFLAETYVPSRRGTLEGGGEQLEAAKARLGIDISPVGRGVVERRSKDSYSTNYKSERIYLDMHIKDGNDRDPRKVFRLYFGWHDEDQRVVVGWFPSHLDNGLT